MRKPKIIIERGHYDTAGRHFMIVSSPKGGDLKLSDIHNEFINECDGGFYAIILNCVDDELTDKVSRVEVYDILDLIEKR